MAVGIKASEIQQDETGIDLGEHFLAVTSLGTSRVRRLDINGLDGRIIFVIGTTSPSVSLNDATHYRRFLSVNNTASTVAFSIPPIDQALPPIEGVNFGGLYASFVIASSANDVSFVVSDPNTLRGVGGGSPLVVADTLYVGLNRSLADEAIVHLYKRGGLWVAESTSGWRDTPDGDGLRNIDITSDQNREITDADHARPVWLTNASPGVLTFQSDIAVGTQTTITNGGSNTASFNFGTHTNLSGDLSIPPGQAASIIVGPTVSGTNRSIFVAASS